MAVRDGWIIYAAIGVLVCLLLWRVATQWKVKSAEAENLRASVVIFGVIGLVLVVWQGVRQASLIAAPSQDTTITVFAAASMTNALDDVNETFTTRTGIKVVASYDASSALMKQIEGGAAVDAFVSADLKWIDYGVEKKVVNESTCINLLGNVLVLIAGKDSKIDHVDIEPGFDLAKLAGGAEECFKWARDASDENVRESYTKMGQHWLECAERVSSQQSSVASAMTRRKSD
jgi:hypothetical protein